MGDGFDLADIPDAELRYKVGLNQLRRIIGRGDLRDSCNELGDFLSSLSPGQQLTMLVAFHNDLWSYLCPISEQVAKAILSQREAS